jgi:hypothetical protein
MQNMISQIDWVATLFLSIYELVQNRPKLRVVVGSAAAHPEDGGVIYVDAFRSISEGEAPDEPHYVWVEITNYGRQPTIIKGITFKNKKTDQYVSPRPEFRSDPLPSKIAPGEIIKYFYPYSLMLNLENDSHPICFRDFVFKGMCVLNLRHSWSRKPKQITRFK